MKIVMDVVKTANSRESVDASLCTSARTTSISCLGFNLLGSCHWSSLQLASLTASFCSKTQPSLLCIIVSLVSFKQLQTAWLALLLMFTIAISSPGSGHAVLVMFMMLVQTGQ